jgi:hypothetical protein
MFLDADGATAVYLVDVRWRHVVAASLARYFGERLEAQALRPERLQALPPVRELQEVVATSTSARTACASGLSTPRH